MKDDRAKGKGKPTRAPRARTPERADDAAPDGTERIAKRLARAGIASRRDAEALIADGRVAVNGRVLDSPAVNVARDDTILLDGKPIPAIERTRLFLFHKPAGVVTTNRDPEGRRTVFDVLPEGLPRLMTVGRLDINTEGLLLLTNDGGLARVLELPSTGWLRRYRVRVHGRVDEKALAGLKDGIAVGGVFYGAIEATLEREQGSNAWITIGIREGKNREVRNVMNALGLEVTRLIRVSYGPFQLGELAEGAILELKGRMLRDQLGARLIEEAGADFEAPVTAAFSNKPVEGEPEPRAPKAERPTRRPRDERQDALDKMTTRPGRAEFPKRGDGRNVFQKRPAKGREDERREEPPRSRSTNVWMAPGARPQGKKTVVGEDLPERTDPVRKPPRGDRERGDRARPPREGASGAPRRDGRPDHDRRESRGPGMRPDRPGYGKRQPEGGNADRPRSDRPQGGGPRGDKARADMPRSDGPSGARTDGPGDKRREFRPRQDRPAHAEKRERATDAGPGAAARSDRGHVRRDAGERATRPETRERPEGKRPPRTDKPAGERFRPRTDRPGGDRPAADRPRGERPEGTRPRREGPSGDRPKFDRPKFDRPPADRAKPDRPRPDRPHSDGPRSDGPRDGSGAGAGARPERDARAPSRGAPRPGVGKPGGGKPRGGKPGGAPRGGAGSGGGKGAPSGPRKGPGKPGGASGPRRGPRKD